PDWARSLGAQPVAASPPPGFTRGYSLFAPLIETTIYLEYLANRFRKAGGEICGRVHFDKLEDVSPGFDVVINCAGIGARELVNDVDLEPHRGQVVVVPQITSLSFAIACDTSPLMYAIPRSNDCVFGGTNDVSDDRTVDPAATRRILAECMRVLNL